MCVRVRVFVFPGMLSKRVGGRGRLEPSIKAGDHAKMSGRQPITPGASILSPAGHGKVLVLLGSISAEVGPETSFCHFVRQQGKRHPAERHVGSVHLPEQNTECIAAREERWGKQ